MLHLILGNDIVHRRTEHADLDLDSVAMHHLDRRIALVADTAGCARDNDIARCQRGKGRAIGSEPLDGEQQIAKRGVLHHLAVHADLHSVTTDPVS